MRFSTHFYFASCRLLQHARKKAFCNPLPSLVARFALGKITQTKNANIMYRN